MRGWLVAAAAFLVPGLPPPAQGAVGIEVKGDVLEESPVTFVATGSTTVQDKVWAKLREAGEPCAASFSADRGDVLFFGVAAGAQETAKMEDPGDRVVCAYLGPGPSETRESATVPVVIRPNRATLRITAPGAVKQGSRFVPKLVGTTELERALYLLAKPLEDGPCGADAAADVKAMDIGTSGPARGSFSVTARLEPGFEDTGTYRLCAYLQEVNGEVEATADAVVRVVVPLPKISIVKTALSAFPARRKTRILYDLNTDATVAFTIHKTLPGVIAGNRCRAPAAGSSGEPCYRPGRRLRTFRHRGEGGIINKLPFRARARGKPLPAGTYLLVARARTAAGSGRAAVTVFYIRRP